MILLSAVKPRPRFSNRLSKIFMDKKTALVIGGNGGVGSEAARQLLHEGFHVYATYFNNQDVLNQLVSSENSQYLHTVRCDVTKSLEVQSMVNKIIETSGSIDVVIFSVTAPLKNSRALDLEWNDFEVNFNLQTKPLLFSVQALAEQMRSGTKAKFIVVLTEYCIGTPPKGLSHYVSSKYAAMGLAKTLSVELAEYQSTVNMISPGMVETPLLDALPPKLIEITAYNNPLKRNAIPDDIGGAISFLASGQSDFINGANLVINGGGVLV